MPSGAFSSFIFSNLLTVKLPAHRAGLPGKE